MRGCGGGRRESRWARLRRTARYLVCIMETDIGVIKALCMAFSALRLRLGDSRSILLRDLPRYPENHLFSVMAEGRPARKRGQAGVRGAFLVGGKRNSGLSLRLCRYSVHFEFEFQLSLGLAPFIAIHDKPRSCTSDRLSTGVMSMHGILARHSESSWRVCRSISTCGRVNHISCHKTQGNMLRPALIDSPGRRQFDPPSSPSQRTA